MAYDLHKVPVLVTGGGGFIASHLIADLLTRGAIVHTVLRPGSCAKRLSALSIQPQIHRLDMRDFDAVRELVDGLKPEIVFNLAVARANDTPDILAQTNVRAALSLLEACRFPQFRRFVSIGSSLERLVETQDAPTTPYALSRHEAMVRLKSQSSIWGVPYAHLRAYYVYGPLQPETKLIPTALQSVRNGTSCPVTTSASAKDFVHAADVVRACVATALLDDSSPVDVDIATGQRWSAEEVIAAIEDIVGRPIPTHPAPQLARAWDGTETNIDLGPARERLNWEPMVFLRDGLRDLIGKEALNHAS